MSLGSLTLSAPTARDLVEVMQLLAYAHVTDQQETIRNSENDKAQY